ncbi:hypothetical protein [Acetanaerobacterium elongatum]|uniref:DUF4367 domain-containing protein n=1 Tax=Acetanaerobacterium elongatum TaxID=258515 RepID=A0A1H0AI25_9FIRM|nr:hypothetical protein [Acetanaerobacterium elongatum]SDN33220.1 hypothetical protein SAMN05192585_11636 [Acetanaerobacterium elongatum]
MKKLLVVLSSLMLLVTLAACGNGTPKNDASAAVPNPIAPSTAEEIQSKLGISIAVPKDATEVAYTIIADKTAQADFTLNNTACNYRIEKADALLDISGMYYEWTTKKDCKVGSYNGQLRLIDGKQGYCSWFDDSQKLLHSVSVESGASEESLLAVANSLL